MRKKELLIRETETAEKAQKALNQLVTGQKTINQLRNDNGLKPLDDCNAYVTKG